jgi:hypothetical protein
MRNLGIAAKIAEFYSRFFYIAMLSVSGIMINSMNHRKGVKVLGDETPRSLRHTLAALITPAGRNTGAGVIRAGPAAASIIPASFLIHSN